MTTHENKLWNLGYKHIVGVDEVGRGPWAGPLVVAGVILPINYNNPLIRDSKQMSAKDRDVAYRQIINDCISYAIVTIPSHEMDLLNIKVATRQAMTKVIETLEVIPDYALIDFEKLNLQIPSLSLIKGDSLSISIASASIVAKVTRDNIMHNLDQKFPAYSFSKHKGYGTRLHYQSLLIHGLCAEHRLSYKPIQKVQQLWIKNLHKDKLL